MRWLLHTTLLGVAFTACQSAGPPVTHVEEAPTVTIDEEGLLDVLDTLGTIAYDHPERFIHHPDSFINLLPRQPTSPEGKELYAWLLLNIGYALREHGRIRESIRYYETALTYCAGEQLTEPDRVLYIAKPLGNLYTQVGDLQKALHIQLEAIRLTVGQPAQQAALYSNLAIVYQQLGQPDSVLQTCKSGLAYLHPTDRQAALLYNTLARCYQEIGEADSARMANTRALALLSGGSLQGDTVLWYTEALHQRASLAAGQHQVGAALGDVNRAVALMDTYFPTSKSREKAKYYYMRGNLHRLGRRPTEARADFERVLHQLGVTEGRLPPDYTITDALWGLARVHAAPDSVIHYYTSALEHAYYTQQLITSKASHYQNSAWNRTLLQEGLASLHEAYALETHPAGKQALALRMLWVIELSKGRQLLQEVSRTNRWDTAERDDLRESRQRLQYLYGQLASATDSVQRAGYQRQIAETAFQLQLAEQHFDRDFAPPAMADFHHFVEHIPDSRMPISYFMPDSGLALAVYRADGEYHVHAIDHVEQVVQHIGRFMQGYFHSGPDAYENDPHAYQQQAHALRETLLPFVGEQPHRELIISLDGILFTLPFDALMADGQFLAQTHPVSYTYTLLLNQRHTRGTSFQPDIRCFAKSDYGGELPDLPSVAAEKQLLADRFHGRVMEGSALTDAALLDALEHGSLLHIAAHAVTGNNASPYLAFDQPFTLDKLRYAITQSPLVVLSACHTAAGVAVQAEGLESLNKAFISKGVMGVIAAYWPVDDATMPQFMESFYEQLANHHIPSLALARAKQRYLQKATPAHRNPWYWATLNYTGVETRIILPGRSRWHYPLVGLGVVCLLGLGWWWYRRRKNKDKI